MLHRLSLRILPQLYALVTDPPVRKRKRWVMVAPGLVAFGIYRGLKHVLPLSDPFVLLGLCGVLSSLTAVWAFLKGRGCSLADSIREDGRQLWIWLVGWIGFMYGVQLSLLVLSLLQIFVNYDFLLHPEGPAMMAIIIACTSVTRDAFEIGYVQRMVHEGVPVPTFPDGKAFWKWVSQDWRKLGLWGSAGLLVGGLASWGLETVGPSDWQPIIQSVGVPLLVATVSLGAFLVGQGQWGGGHDLPKRPVYWWSGLQFWVWPAFTFAATYFLVLWGIGRFVLPGGNVSSFGLVGMAGMVGLLMTTYTLFLGWRKSYEEKTLAIPESVQRCPFVMGILQNSKNFMSSRTITDLKSSQS